MRRNVVANGQHRGDKVSRARQQAAEIHLLSTLSAERGRPTAGVQVCLVDPLRHQSDGVDQLVVSSLSSRHIANRPFILL